jgi:hypothetical protein
MPADYDELTETFGIRGGLAKVYGDSAENFEYSKN